MIYVIINEQHTLMEEQHQILDTEFGTGKWKKILVPAEGWTRDEMAELRKFHREFEGDTIVFASPIPTLLRILAEKAAERAANNHYSDMLGQNLTSWGPKMVRVFANDTREKKELPGGKIIHVVAKTGWYLG